MQGSLLHARGGTGCAALNTQPVARTAHPKVEMSETTSPQTHYAPISLERAASLSRARVPGTSCGTCVLQSRLLSEAWIPLPTRPFPPHSGKCRGGACRSRWGSVEGGGGEPPRMAPFHSGPQAPHAPQLKLPLMGTPGCGGPDSWPLPCAGRPLGPPGQAAGEDTKGLSRERPQSPWQPLTSHSRLPAVGGRRLPQPPPQLGPPG